MADFDAMKQAMLNAREYSKCVSEQQVSELIQRLRDQHAVCWDPVCAEAANALESVQSQLLAQYQRTRDVFKLFHDAAVIIQDTHTLLRDLMQQSVMLTPQQHGELLFAINERLSAISGDSYA